jgi:hypothetical protein
MKASFPDGFAEKFKEAVDKTKGKKDPILIVALASHGDKGIIGRQPHDYISYDDLLDTLFKNSFEVNKDITLMLFVDACHSGSIIPIIQKKLSCDANKENCTFEGTDGAHYKYKISIYTSAPSDERSWENEFLEGLNDVSNLEDCKDKESCGLNDNGVSKFMSSKHDDDYVIWRSFSGKNEKLLSLNSDKKGLKQVIEDNIFILQNDIDVSGRVNAASLLGDIAPQGDKVVIEALSDALKNDVDKRHVRKVAKKALREIDPKDQ